MQGRITLTRRGRVTVGVIAALGIVSTGIAAKALTGPSEIPAEVNDTETPRAAPQRVGEDAVTTGIPGIGVKMSAAIPESADQALVVSGEGPDSSTSHAILYTWTGHEWRGGGAWPARNAVKGWTREHVMGDLRSPIGVFGLTAAGGQLAAPSGARVPYDHSELFVASGRGVEGEPLDGAFDYVVAIDYNRVAGTSPLDPARPEGKAKGGGIWLHVDHGGGTQGCVALSRDHMRELLRSLDPGKNPVIVMGDGKTLAS
ncbi:L,D-transpeptidase family protein [Streptomyces venezuelae]|uniref:L,D-transpeptidase family protein n=1 Tax=Streptomyces venezuelae TaxID=54571 RepID=UPI0036593D35